jgi:hypothetical protein
MYLGRGPIRLALAPLTFLHVQPPRFRGLALFLMRPPRFADLADVR